jgi:DnaJ family protein C protein 8
MVHPDKCSHPRAKDAFEVVGAAQKDLLDEEQRKRLDFLLTFAKGAPVGLGLAWKACRDLD